MYPQSGREAIMKYVYPAVFTPEDKAFSVRFPDVDGCFTCGDDLVDACAMAQDALAFRLFDYECAETPAPEPSAVTDVKLANGEFVSLVLCDTIDYKKRTEKKAVKKTLTIPSWMDDLAIRREINFSQLLQKALARELDIT
jgi:predicted RNase H-like HicB family nuclease